MNDQRRSGFIVAAGAVCLVTGVIALINHESRIANISMLFAERHGEQLGRELGIDQTTLELNMDGVKAGFGVDPSTEQLTYRELQSRRALIQKRMRDQIGR